MANVLTQSTGRRAAPKPPHRKSKRRAVRTGRLQMRISKAELERWRAEAKRERVPLAEWARRRLVIEADHASIVHERAALIAMRVVVNRLIDTIGGLSKPPADVVADLEAVRTSLADVIARQLGRIRR